MSPRKSCKGCRPPAAAGLPSPRSPSSTLVLPLAYPRASLKPNYQEMAWAPASRVSAPAQESRSAGMRGWDLGQPAGRGGNQSKWMGWGKGRLWIPVRCCGDPQGCLEPSAQLSLGRPYYGQRKVTSSGLCPLSLSLFFLKGENLGCFVVGGNAVDFVCFEYSFISFFLSTTYLSSTYLPTQLPIYLPISIYMYLPNFEAESHHVALAGLELMSWPRTHDLPAPVPQVVGLQMCPLPPMS